VVVVVAVVVVVVVVVVVAGGSVVVVVVSLAGVGVGVVVVPGVKAPGAALALPDTHESTKNSRIWAAHSLETPSDVSRG
jgi:hypothetical protein